MSIVQIGRVSVTEMSIDVGSIVEGTVIKLADYGAIVRLPAGNTGLIHISEIADTFVRNVKDYFKEQDRVRVKILSINPKGRYELSIKQVEQPVQVTAPIPQKRKPVPRPPDPVYLGPDEWGSTPRTTNASEFDDRLTRFMKDSQERILDLKRNIDLKQGVKRR